MIRIFQIKFQMVKPLLFLLSILCIIYIFLTGMRSFNNSNTIFLLTQLTVIPVTGLIIIYIFNDLFGTKNSLFLYSFYKNKIMNIYNYGFLILFFPSVLICIVLKVQYEDFNFIAALFLLFTQLLLISSLAFLVFSITSDLALTFTLFALYISTELATLGSFEKMYHVFYMNLYDPINFDNTISITVLNLIIGFVFNRINKMLFP